MAAPLRLRSPAKIRRRPAFGLDLRRANGALESVLIASYHCYLQKLKYRYYSILIAGSTYAMKRLGALSVWLNCVGKASCTTSELFHFIFLFVSIPCFKGEQFLFQDRLFW